MSGFMKIGLVILCVLGIQALKGQDTICKLSGECFTAEIIKTSTAKIRYRTPGALKNASIQQKDLAYIRFQNGRLDVFKSDLKFNVDTHNIYITKKSLVYKGTAISNKGVLNLITEYPYVEKREVMLHLHTQLRRNNRNRVTFGILGIAYTAFGGLVLASSGGYIGDVEAAMAITFLGTGAVCTGISQICNYRYHLKKKKVVASYNTF